MANYTQEKIRKIIKERGTSPSAVSLAAGLDASYLRKLFDRPDAVPKHETLDRIAGVLGVGLSDLIDPSVLAKRMPGISTHQSQGQDMPGIFGADEFRSAGDIKAPGPMAMANDVPVMGTAAGSFAGAFKYEDGIVDYVRRPPALVNARDIYAIFVEGESMFPEHKPGDLRFVNPHKPAKIGDSVVVQTQNAPEQQVEAMIGHLLKRTAEHIVIGKLNPESTVRVNRETVKAVHKVLTMNDLFGV